MIEVPSNPIHLLARMSSPGFAPGQLALRYDYTTLNAVNYPTSGLAIHAAAMGLLGRTWINATPGHHVKWLQISGNAG